MTEQAIEPDTATDTGAGGPPKAVKRRPGRNTIRRIRCAGVMDGLVAGLNDRSVVFDLGANVGKVTASLAHTGARIMSFEPDEIAFAELEKRAHPFPNVVLHNAAVGVSDGSATLFRSNKFESKGVGATVSSTVMFGKKGSVAENAITVRQLALVPILEREIATHGRIDFLKMDVEGSELTILPALVEAGLLDRIRYIAVETHERKFPGARRDFKALRRSITRRYDKRHVNLDWV
ncbi:FkbM family methyltransferase [Salibaculum sp.]|uniref:FkbM family methyltransferase n=1 Tax=Salibaculum sp. TaxID=2855480 RepID=UPI002B487585|nr:FkbM family methyltransferase [Salibaculum sp.]HKL68370.1 FkbM family methyltransferase [Salibaculum sp.]